MTITMKASGINEVRLFLQNIANRTMPALKAEMRKAAEDTADLAIKMAPAEFGDLEDSITVVEPSEQSKQRYHVSVVAGGPGFVKDTGVPVSQYAAIMHENYESIVSDPETLARKAAKEAATGEIVGSKFLTRALERTNQGLAQRLGRALLLIGGIEP